MNEEERNLLENINVMVGNHVPRLDRKRAVSIVKNQMRRNAQKDGYIVILTEGEESQTFSEDVLIAIWKEIN